MEFSGPFWKKIFLYGVQVVGGSNPLAPTKRIKGLQISVCNPFSIVLSVTVWLPECIQLVGFSTDTHRSSVGMADAGKHSACLTLSSNSNAYMPKRYWPEAHPGNDPVVE